MRVIRLYFPPPLYISAHNDGAQKVIESLKDIINTQSGDESLILTTSYAIECVKNTLDSICEATKVLKSGELELCAYHIRDALDLLSRITHSFESAELLDKLFGTFCLGK